MVGKLDSQWTFLSQAMDHLKASSRNFRSSSTVLSILEFMVQHLGCIESFGSFCPKEKIEPFMCR